MDEQQSRPPPRCATQAMLAAYADLRGALWVLIALHRRGAPVQGVVERMMDLGRQLASAVGEACPEAGQAFHAAFASHQLACATGAGVLNAARDVEAAMDFVWEDSNGMVDW